MSAHIFHAVDVWFSRTPFTQWVGRRSNPRLLVFSQALHLLSYRPNKTTIKKARCPYDTGLSLCFGNVRPGITYAMDNRRADSPYDRRTVLSLSIVVWYLAVTSNCLFLLTVAYLSNTLDTAKYRKIPKNSRQFDDQELIFFAHNSKDALILLSFSSLSSAIRRFFHAHCRCRRYNHRAVQSPSCTLCLCAPESTPAGKIAVTRQANGYCRGFRPAPCRDEDVGRGGIACRIRLASPVGLRRRREL